MTKQNDPDENGHKHKIHLRERSASALEKATRQGEGDGQRMRAEDNAEPISSVENLGDLPGLDDNNREDKPPSRESAAENAQKVPLVPKSGRSSEKR